MGLRKNAGPWRSPALVPRREAHGASIVAPSPGDCRSTRCGSGWDAAPSRLPRAQRALACGRDAPPAAQTIRLSVPHPLTPPDAPIRRTGCQPVLHRGHHWNSPFVGPPGSGPPSAHLSRAILPLSPVPHPFVRSSSVDTTAPTTPLKHGFSTPRQNASAEQAPGLLRRAPQSS